MQQISKTQLNNYTGHSDQNMHSINSKYRVPPRYHSFNLCSKLSLHKKRSKRVNSEVPTEEMRHTMHHRANKKSTLINTLNSGEFENINIGSIVK